MLIFNADFGFNPMRIKFATNYINDQKYNLPISLKNS
jgi:hypothetical protein